MCFPLSLFQISHLVMSSNISSADQLAIIVRREEHEGLERQKCNFSRCVDFSGRFVKYDIAR